MEFKNSKNSLNHLLVYLDQQLFLLQLLIKISLKSESYISSYIPAKKSIPSGIKIEKSKFDYLLNIDRM